MNKEQAKKARQKRMKLSRLKDVNYTIQNMVDGTIHLLSKDNPNNVDDLILEAARLYGKDAERTLNRAIKGAIIND